MELTFEDALRIARGCTDYGGGHRSNPEHYEIYQHGIQTVINALTAASKTGLDDMQTRALHSTLSAPRWPRAPWPLNVIAAAVDGYYEAFFSVLIPPGYGGNHTKPIAVADRRIRRGLRGCGDDRHSEEESGAAGDCGPGSA